MPYSIALRVYQTNPCHGTFHIVEKTCWHYANGGIWYEAPDGRITLTMGGSGTSGVLRFVSDTSDERITVAVGVHNYYRWCDIVTGLAPHETGLVVNGEYYGGTRDYMREKQLTNYSVTSNTGTKIQILYTVADGDNLKANIIFG